MFTTKNDELFKLAGMKYKQGYFTAEEWKHKTGIDPRNYPGYIRINPAGLCIWTDKAESLYQDYSAQVSNNFYAIGASNHPR